MFSTCGDSLHVVASGKPSRHQHASGLPTAPRWLLLDAANSAPGVQGLTTRMDERIEESLNPTKVLSQAHHVLPTPCAYICLRSSIPNSPRPPIPLLETAGGELERLEGYETMLDDTSPSGTCDLQKKTAHHAHQHQPAFRAKERFAQASATCDWTLGVAFSRPFVF